MTSAQVFGSSELVCRRLDRALARAVAQHAANEEAFARLQTRLAGLQEALADIGTDPRALAALNALREYFAGNDRVVVELDYVKSLLRRPAESVQ